MRLTNAITRAFPPLLPYAGAFDDVIPHLTVAGHVTPDVLDALEGELRHGLPIASRAEQAIVIERCDFDTSWTTRATLPLGRAR